MNTEWCILNNCLKTSHIYVHKQGTYTLNAYHIVPLLACHTGGWCLCYCCTQIHCIDVDGTQQLWLLLSIPPCWRAWCLQYLENNALRKLALCFLSGSEDYRQASSIVSNSCPVIKERILKLLSVISKCHRFILRSSAERYVSWSLFTEMELMW